MTELDPRLNIVAVTGIVVKPRTRAEHGAGQGWKFLIMKRSKRETAFPGKWTVPGGKFMARDVLNERSAIKSYVGRYDVVSPTLRRELREEAGVEVDDIRYLTDYVFLRPDGIPVLGLSFWCRWKSGEVKPGDDMVDHAWVTLEEAKHYDLIEGIWEELAEVDRVIKGETS